MVDRPEVHLVRRRARIDRHLAGAGNSLLFRPFLPCRLFHLFLLWYPCPGGRCADHDHLVCLQVDHSLVCRSVCLLLCRLACLQVYHSADSSHLCALLRRREDGTHSVQDEQRAPRFHVHLRVLVEAEHHGLRESLVDALANAFLELRVAN